MNKSKSFIFKPLTENDITLLYEWFQEPVINQRYARGKPWSLEDLQQKYIPRIIGKDNVPSFIISLDNHPLGFIQYYSLLDHLPEGILHRKHPLFASYQPNELAGMDVFIAASEQRGKGLGSQILEAFITNLPHTIRAILIDPERNNHQAIRCYEKAGFHHTDYSEDKNYLLLIKTLR